MGLTNRVVQNIITCCLLTVCTFTTPTRDLRAEGHRPTLAQLLGGSQIDLSQSPVALILTNEYMCTGLLVGKHEVITAGHCLAAQASEFTVQVGTEKHSVSQVVRSAAFSEGAPATLAFIKYDLGMILLDSPVETVQPASVLNDLRITSGDTLTVIGRGANELPNREQALGEGRTGDFLVDDANGSVIVTTSLIKKSSTCPGDSGAPVFKRIGNATFAVGVVSAGTNFANSQGKCVVNGRGLSVFVDLQSETSQLFLSQFDGVQHASGRALFVAERLQKLTSRITTTSIKARAPKLIKELVKLRQLASEEQRISINTMIRSLRSLGSSSSRKAHTSILRKLRIAAEQARAL